MAADTYRKADASDVPALSKLAHRVLQPHALPGWNDRAIQRLLASMFDFVGARAPEVSVVEVNATEYSLPFYRRHGFYPLSGFIDYEGCRFARLGYWRKNPLLSK